MMKKNKSITGSLYIDLLIGLVIIGIAVPVFVKTSIQFTKGTQNIKMASHAHQESASLLKKIMKYNWDQAYPPSLSKIHRTNFYLENVKGTPSSATNPADFDKWQTLEPINPYASAAVIDDVDDYHNQTIIKKRGDIEFVSKVHVEYVNWDLTSKSEPTTSSTPTDLKKVTVTTTWGDNNEIVYSTILSNGGY